MSDGGQDRDDGRDDGDGDAKKPATDRDGKDDGSKDDGPEDDGGRGDGGQDDDDKKGADKKGDDKKGDDKKDEDEDEHPVRKAKWPWIVGGVVVVAFIVVVLLILFLPHAVQKTDDAYVRVHYATVAPRVSGQVVQVAVTDNQPVRAGALLVALDPRDYQASLDQALAQAAQDRAQILQARAQVTRQPALIAQARAQVLSARAALALSDANARRYTNLAATGAGSQQQRQTSDAQRQQDEASVAQALANLQAARDQLRALVADRKSAEAKLQSDEAQVEQARLNLSYTRIVAPIDGLVDQKSTQVGDYVSPGSGMMVVVPLHSVYVEAHYRELALRHVLPGQHVRIHVDAYDIWLDGVVQGVAAASGASFSPIPPNNATGNFTKIVQRLPVKILVSPNQRLAGLLRVGMSVETYIDTHLDPVVADQRGTDARVVSP